MPSQVRRGQANEWQPQVLQGLDRTNQMLFASLTDSVELCSFQLAISTKQHKNSSEKGTHTHTPQKTTEKTTPHRSTNGLLRFVLFTSDRFTSGTRRFSSMRSLRALPAVCRLGWAVGLACPWAGREALQLVERRFT